MEKIKDIKERTKKNKKMGLFRCQFCLKAAKKPLQQGARQLGCGCVRKWARKLPESGAEKRTCLMCDELFWSRGAYNRRCPACEKKVENAGYNTYYEPPIYGHTANSNMKACSED